VASVVAGVVGVAAIPAGILVARYTEVTLLQSTASIGVAMLFGLYAIVLARRGRERVQMTLGRAEGDTAASIGRILAVVALWGAGAAALAVGFFGLLTLFAS
jgi:hypothetical protein